MVLALRAKPCTCVHIRLPSPPLLPSKPCTCINIRLPSKPCTCVHIRLPSPKHNQRVQPASATSGGAVRLLLPLLLVLLFLLMLLLPPQLPYQHNYYYYCYYDCPRTQHYLLAGSHSSSASTHRPLTAPQPLLMFSSPSSVSRLHRRGGGWDRRGGGRDLGIIKYAS